MNDDSFKYSKNRYLSTQKSGIIIIEFYNRKPNISTECKLVISNLKRSQLNETYQHKPTQYKFNFP